MMDWPTGTEQPFIKLMVTSPTAHRKRGQSTMKDKNFLEVTPSCILLLNYIAYAEPEYATIIVSDIWTCN